MGLDMMLYKLKKGVKPTDENLNDEVAYWRKANAIHGFIYKNCALKGQKDYDYIKVDKCWLLTLKDICLNILDEFGYCEQKTKRVEMGWRSENGKVIPQYATIKVYDTKLGKKLLPVTKGFFFGSYNYSESYKQDLEDTVNQINEVLRHTNFEEYDLWYYASY